MDAPFALFMQSFPEHRLLVIRSPSETSQAPVFVEELVTVFFKQHIYRLKQ